MQDSVVQDIKDRIDVSELIGSYIQTKRSGTNFKAACPFHNEKTPSLMISPAKQIWHCFGCGEGGDIFGFVMRYENVGFPEAIRILADKAGVQLPQRQYQNNDEKELLRRINNFASNYYHQLLLSSKHADTARKYLEQRGLKSETIAKWKIGFAPDDYHALEKALLQKKVRLEDMIKAGVVIKSDKGGFYDRFRNRITFPIFNYAGDVVGFSARTLDADAETAKYINSPETAIYNKSRTVFGLHQGRDAIRKLNQVVVVEGQMDVISSHQAGFTNVVATSGTALTEGHLQLLGRLSKNMVFCFDADEAGQRATRKASELALSQGFRLKIMRLPQGKDPDELVQQDPSLWQKSIEGAVWAVDYYIDEVNRLVAGSVEQARAVRESLSPLISQLSDPIEQDHYIQKIANVFGLKPEAISRTIAQNKQGTAALDSPALAPSFRYGNDETLEKQLLGGAMLLPHFRSDIVQTPDWEQAFAHTDIKNLVAKIVSNDGPIPEEVLLEPLAKEAQFMVESLIENLDLSQEAILRELDKSLFTLMLRHIRSQQHEVSLGLAQAEHQNAKEKVQELRLRFQFLSTQRMEFENKIENL